jgi:hypothetical protein
MNAAMFDQLDKIMETDHVVQVHADGTVTDGPAGLYAPGLVDDELDSSHWEFFSTGYTGQYGYAGPIMHDSEFIGGRLARDILAEPGIYVAVAACYLPDDNDEEITYEGWAVARYVGPDFR